uniref:RNA-directed DNA polymerase homolog n=1 Tax=Tanacetum cinerariifolium TaxID=118510 RepID=A0A6L2NPI8_TANCI|nr:RNA-directed DNA polymerase homolog [Tanacetum cinerariifolium]
MIKPSQPIPLKNDNNPRVLPILLVQRLGFIRTTIPHHGGTSNVKKKEKMALNGLLEVVSHDEKWAKEEEEEDSNKVHAVYFYLGTEPIEPLEWKALENRLKPSSVEPLTLELKELPKHLEINLPHLRQSLGESCTGCPKNGGMTVVKNEKDEIIPQRIITGWYVCIDYRKLNNTTRKDHFPLSFIDQMLERLAGHEYYCFLDGFSGYFKIPIAPEDQKKTTFTYP